MSHSNTANGMRTFMTIWLGELLSVIGTGLTGFSLGVWVYQRTGSPTLFAFITLSTTLPGVLVSPIAGALVDRWDLRKTMIFADAGAALTSLGIALLLWTGRLEIWHIYIGTGLASVCMAFQQPAYKVAATVLVPKEHYARASGLMQAGFGSQFIISPILAGVLVGVIGIEGVILVDFATYFCALGALLLVRIPRPETTSEGSAGKGSLWQEIAQCWNYLTRHPGLLNVVIVLTIGNFMIAFVAVLAAPMMLSFTSPAVLGVTMSAAGTGMLVGSIVLGVTGGPRRLIRGMVIFMAAGSLGVVVMGLRQHVLLITVACFVFFCSMPFVQGCFETILRKKVVHDLQGRMFAVTRSLILLASTSAYVVAGPLSEYVFEPLLQSDGVLVASVGSVIGVGPGRGIALLFIVAGTLAIIVTALGYLNPRMRNVETELPDVLADEIAEPVPQLEPIPNQRQEPAVAATTLPRPAGRNQVARHSGWSTLSITKEELMNNTDRSILRWGGIASLLLPICFIWLGIFLLIDPAEQHRDEMYWILLAQQPFYTYNWRFAFFLVGLFTLAVIPAIVRVVQPQDGKGAGFLQWTTVIAYLGSASLAIDCMRGLFLTRDYLIEAYTTGDEVMKIATKLAIGAGIDVNGIFQYGGVGLWFVTVGIIALRTATLPRGLAYWAVATGATYIITLFFGLTDWFIPGTPIAIMALTALIGGVIVAPIFHIWLGRYLLRRSATTTVSAQQTAPVTA